jgi:NCAIR mutase (PurE)-related protein
MKHTDPTTLPVTDAPVLSPAAELLLRAADYMEKHGKCNGGLSDAQGRVCTLGAIVSQGKGALEAYRLFVLSIGTYDLPQWSDAHTQAEVVSAMRTAAYGATR